MWNGKIEPMTASRWIKRCHRQPSEINSTPLYLVEIADKEFWADSTDECLRWVKRAWKGSGEIHIFAKPGIIESPQTKGAVGA